MTILSNTVIDLIEVAAGQTTAEQVGSAFFLELGNFGVSALYARAYGVVGGNDAVEQVFSRVSPPGWESFYAEKRFEDANYLLRELKRRQQPFKWSDSKLISPREIYLAQALADYGFPDGLAIPCHGPNGYMGVVSLAFDNLREVSPSERMAIEVASIILHNRMKDLTSAGTAVAPLLSPRERDCLAYIANGQSDAAIAARLGIAEVTVLTHVQNAKRKLGAKTRAQAVAMCVVRGII